MATKTEVKKATVKKATVKKTAVKKTDYTTRRVIAKLVSQPQSKTEMKFAYILLAEINASASANYRWNTEKEKKQDLKNDKDEKLNAVRESIKTVGVNTPVLLVPDKSLTGTQKYALIGGFTRHALAEEAGLKSIPAVILKQDKSEYEPAYLRMRSILDNAENLHRQVSEGNTLIELAKVYKDFGGPTPEFKKAASAITGWSENYALRVLNPYLHAPKPIRNLMERSRIDWRVAEQFVKKTQGEDRKVICEPSMSDADARKVVSDIREQGKDALDRNGKIKRDALRATLGLMAKGGKLPSLKTTVTDARHEPAGNAVGKQAVIDRIEYICDQLVIREACSITADPTQQIKIDGESILLGEAVDEYSYFSLSLAQAAGLAMARDVDGLGVIFSLKTDEDVDAYVTSFKTRSILRAYARAFVTEEWLEGSMSRLNEETGKKKNVKNKTIMEDIVQSVTEANYLSGYDQDGEEIKISDPTLWDKVIYTQSRLDEIMSEEVDLDEGLED